MEVNPNLRVSTMTCISNLNTEIDLKKLFDSVEIDNNLTYIEYGASNQKGSKPSKSNKPRKTEKKKFFYNLENQIMNFMDIY